MSNTARGVASDAMWNVWTKTAWQKTFTTYTITFKDENGTTVETKEVGEGQVPSYTGATDLSRTGKVLKWSPALVAATADATYQAYYVDEPDYLTLTNTSASNATVYFRRQNGNNSNTINIEWSINGGAWSDPRTNKYDNYAAISVPAGQNVRFRGNNTVIDGGVTKCKFSPSSSIYWNITSTNGSFVVSGDVMSLAAYDEANTCIHNEYPLYNYCFYSLFRSGSNNAFTSMRDASGLKLSATLGAYCYQNMFYNCTNLTTAPVLPATTLAQSCYASMFQGCSALTTAPALPAMTLADNCYDAMFQTCTSLTQTPALPATTLASNCYRNMFNDCIALTTTVDVLPALDLPPSCYYYMYNGCTSLVKAPDIEATTMSGSSTNQQCSNMFAGCTALTKAPSVLKVESGLKTSCYYNMFLGCSNMERSPDIKATSLGSQSFYSMFKSCTKLNIIRTYHTAWGSYPTSDWVYGVSDMGVIYCPPTLPRTYSNNTQMPKSSTYQWTVFSYNITFVPKSCSWTDETNANKQFTWETDTTNVMTFLRAESADNAKFYTDAACTTEISVSDITAALATQQEASTATTKNYYVQKVSSYTLDWDANGGELSGDYTAAGSYSAGAEIIAPNATRAGYTYTWNPAFTGTMPAANTTYTAQWTQKSYTLDAKASAGGSGVTRSDNGNSETVKRYGDNVVLTPVANTGYHFTDWTGKNASDLVDNEDGTYTLTIADKADNYEYAVTANFAPNTHRLTWTTDGNTLTGDYTHGEAIAYGTTVTAPDPPTKNATAEYTYTFSAWSPDVAGTMPDKDVEYTATWTETKRQYTLTWDVNGGNALTGTYTYGTIDWGTDIVKPANPTRTDYTFGGWDADNDGKADEVAETMPTNSLTYKAIWVAELPNITLCENCNNDHYNTFKSDYDRKTVNVTYPRQFSASKWSTMCLPFSLDLATMIANKMYGRVYEFKYATGNANTNSGVNLYFSNAKKIEAGNCYIVNADDALAAKTSFVFSGVTIDLTKDNGAALDSEDAYDDLPGYISQGTIELVGTLRNGTLKGSATGNRYMGLKDNKIYYPNISQGSTIWAYRGIFRSSSELNIEKMRIIVDGEDRGELIIDANGDVRGPSDAPSRKFIRDGVLYIEREGVVYDAQGKRVEGSF
ncbi:MAG: InlB B-repeat-containing protein [Paludibacteraceae bacterium]|nr:InlB B-repeat-containing protein [Paludibacteraceae bacterium]